TAEEERRIQDHLESCEVCRERAVDVSAFFDSGEGEWEPTPAERSASWNRMRADLQGEGRFAVRRARSRRRVLQVALAAACLALGAFGLSHYRMLGAQPQILRAAESSKGSEGEIVPVGLPVILKLRLSATADSGAVRAELMAGDGRK